MGQFYRMQKRHTDRQQYFNELYATCQKYYIPYIKAHHSLTRNTQILEIGCGDGGNLLPFSEIGCTTTGIDISETRIRQATSFFAKHNASGNFTASDIFNINGSEYPADIIICHDVIEHISNKREFLIRIKRFMKPGGITFIAFPAWQMPFGGHQQICRSKILSYLPFVHLLPNPLYHAIIRMCHETDHREAELLQIKNSRMTIESFERICADTGLSILNRQLFLINPHYEVKFGLRPHKLNSFISSIPYFRNFLSSSCFYILKSKNKNDNQFIAHYTFV